MTQQGWDLNGLPWAQSEIRGEENSPGSAQRWGWHPEGVAEMSSSGQGGGLKSGLFYLGHPPSEGHGDGTGNPAINGV